jgi:hypothetical protein
LNFFFRPAAPRFTGELLVGGDASACWTRNYLGEESKKMLRWFFRLFAVFIPDL